MKKQIETKIKKEWSKEYSLDGNILVINIKEPEKHLSNKVDEEILNLLNNVPMKIESFEHLIIQNIQIEDLYRVNFENCTFENCTFNNVAGVKFIKCGLVDCTFYNSEEITYTFS
jgi:uncharacterized protein YjbI with pentapeptide repeats